MRHKSRGDFSRCTNISEAEKGDREEEGWFTRRRGRQAIRLRSERYFPSDVRLNEAIAGGDLQGLLRRKG